MFGERDLEISYCFNRTFFFENFVEEVNSRKRDRCSEELKSDLETGMKKYEEIVNKDEYSFAHDDIEKYSFFMDCIDALWDNNIQNYQKEVKRIKDIPKILGKKKLNKNDWNELRYFGRKMQRYYLENLQKAKLSSRFAC